MKINNIDATTLIDSLEEGVVIHNANTEIMYANRRALQILRLTEEQAFGKDAFDPEWRFVDNKHQAIPYQDYPVNRVLALNSAVENIEIGVADSSCEQITWVLCKAHPHLDENGSIEHIVVTFWELATDKYMLPFESIFANANDVIIITEVPQKKGDIPRIVYVNHAFTTLTGYHADEVIGKSPNMLQGKDTCEDTRQRVREAIINKQPIRECILNYSKSGIPYWLDMNIFPLKNAIGEVTHFAAVERDVTEQKQMEAELREMASQDQLTELLNRRGFYDAVTKLIGTHPIHGEAAVAMIDLDHFKDVNDTYGHESGDKALQLIAAKLKAAFRDSDLVCRFGGEEFVVLLPKANLQDAQHKLDAFRERIAATDIQLDEIHSARITLSIGLTHVDTNTVSLEHALNNADKALYQAKSLGRNRLEICTEA